MDQIPLVDILDFVRPRAEEGVNGTPWCDMAETWLEDELGIEFVKIKDPCSCGCGRLWSTYPKGEQRFTPADGSPEMITRESLAQFIETLEEHYSDPDESEVAIWAALNEAVELWKL